MRSLFEACDISGSSQRARAEPAQSHRRGPVYNQTESVPTKLSRRPDLGGRRGPSRHPGRRVSRSSDVRVERRRRRPLRDAASACLPRDRASCARITGRNARDPLRENRQAGCSTSASKRVCRNCESIGAAFPELTWKGRESRTEMQVAGIRNCRTERPCARESRRFPPEPRWFSINIGVYRYGDPLASPAQPNLSSPSPLPPGTNRLPRGRRISP